MHILELPSVFFPRGGGFCLDQAKALASHGHVVRILSCVELGITETPKAYLSLPFGAHWKNIDGIEVYQYYYRRFPKAIRLNNRNWLRHVAAMFEEYVVKYGKPDLIHAHSVHWAGYAAMKISEKWKVPYVITEHSSRAIFEREFGEGHVAYKAWQIPLLKEALKKAACVIPVSAELVDNLKPLLGSDYRFYPISNTIDTDFFKPIAQEKAVDDNIFRFVYPAAFIPLKGFDILLRGMKEFRNLENQEFRNLGIKGIELHLAGKGTDSKAMKKLIASYGLEDIVITHGQLSKEQIRQLYYDCDCLVHPSRSEAQPLICLEATATGIPFIATEAIPASLRFSGCPIVPIDDADALAKAMYEMVSNKVTNMASDKDKDKNKDYSYLYNSVKEIASPEAFVKSFETLCASF